MSTKINRRAFLGTALTFGALCALEPAQAFGVTKAEVQAAKDKLDAMSEEVDSAVDSYNKAQDTYSSASAKVKEAQKQIDEAQAKIKSSQGRLATRATSMYRNGSMSYLDVLLGVGSFSDFATVWDTLNTLNEQDADLVAETKAAKAELVSAKKTLDEKKQEAANSLAEAKSYQEQVKSKEAQYKSEYNSLSSEYKEQIEAAQRQAAAAARAAARRATSSSSSSSSSSKHYSAGSKIPTHGSVVEYAESQLGVPYVWGGATPGKGFDCSGLVMWCYSKVGISLPHYTGSQYACAKARISPESAEAGDVLYRSGHVAISVGGTNYIHAPHSGAVVCYGSGGSWQCALRF